MRKSLIVLVIFIIAGCYTVYAQQGDVPVPLMVSVEGGTFMMGNISGTSDERPLHKVSVNNFQIGEYEVTISEFKRFIDATGYKTDAEQPDTVRLKHGLPPRGIYNGSWKMDMNGNPVNLQDTLKPVGNVSWNDAMEYCKWLSRETGKQFRLPTEAEWEYAAKGGPRSKGYTYAGGNNLDEVAWYRENSRAYVHSVGQKKANELGLYDMAGNVREWCYDWYGDTYYQTSPEENPAGPDRGTRRVLRGGSFGSDAERMRISYRNQEFPYNSALDFGFRIVIPGERVVKAEPPKKDEGLLKDLDTKGFIDIYGINFDIGKATVKPESFPIIDQIVTYLDNHPQMRIVIEGHTDNTGSVSLNQTLSEKRAQSIKAEIVKRGIDPGRMETIGYGSSKPVADNGTAAGRTQNRRVTIKKL
jgi:formylglycine-generating enzyme required for sulfatase activity